MRTLILIVLLCLAASCLCQSHDLVVGQVTDGDVIVYKAIHRKKAKTLAIRSGTVIYPRPGVKDALITAIYIKDNKQDGTGGYASIYAGGVGKRFVEIELLSQRGLGYSFYVTIYGRY